jgi:apolipoprotein N-acyltransferase
LPRVKSLWEIPFFRSRSLLAILAGLLWTAAFPKIGIAGFAWIAPGLMIAAALGKRGGEAFRLGYIAGLTHYLTMLYWLLLIPYRWHGIPFGPALGWLSLSAFLALFPAAWVSCCVQSPKSKAQSPESTVHTPQSAVPNAEFEGLHSQTGVLARGWVGRTTWALGGAAAWVGWEMILARILGGFPWDLLGVSQYRMLPLIQIASVTAVYGVSFLIVWVSLALLSAGLMVIRRPTTRSVWVGEIFLPVLTVAFLFNIGMRELRNEPPRTRSLKVAFVQPSIPQTLIWDANNDAQRFDELIRLSEQALQEPTDLLVWPESAVPKMIRYDKDTLTAITNLAATHHAWIILVSDDAEPRPGSSNRREVNYFNSSFLVSPQGHLVERYLKRNLVMFGEFVPFQHWMPFLKYFTPIEGGFTPGTQAVPFELRGLQRRARVLICFEDVFPHLVRKDMDPETDFFVNLTNDGWFGEGAAQWQQAASALFRTVENRVPLLRCSNNGLTCWIDVYGRLVQIFRDERGSVYGPGVMRAEIPVRDPGQRQELTFYTRHGDWFGWSCLAVGIAWVAMRLIRWRIPKAESPRAEGGPKSEIRNPKAG